MDTQSDPRPEDEKGHGLDAESPTAPSGFHHVVFMVDDVYPMELVRDEHQEIVALASVKMSLEKARKLKEMVDKYLDNHQDGGDMFTYTLRGSFK